MNSTDVFISLDASVIKWLQRREKEPNNVITANFAVFRSPLSLIQSANQQIDHEKREVNIILIFTWLSAHIEEHSVFIPTVHLFFDKKTV